MDNEIWLERLQSLCVQYSHLGVSADVASLSIVEAWGLYLFLSRLAEG